MIPSQRDCQLPELTGDLECSTEERATSWQGRIMMKPLEAEELIPLLADLKKAVDCLLTVAEQDRRSIDSMYEVLAIHSENIRLLTQGVIEAHEGEDGRNLFLSSTLKEIKTKKNEQRRYNIYT